MKVVISYSRLDIAQADRLASDLQMSHINPWVDKKSITEASVWMREIDQALTEADFVLGVVTDSYLESTGSLEGYATIAADRQQQKRRFIPLFFQDPDSVHSTIIRAIQGIRFDTSYEDGLSQLLEVLHEPQVSAAKNVTSRIESPDYRNPFYRVRTELYGNDYKLIAKAFAQPESTLYEHVQGNTSLYLFGGRGVGKTMLLKSLTPDVVCSRLKVKTFKDAIAKGIGFFGFYFRLKRGCLTYYDQGPAIRMAFERLGVPFEYNLYKDLKKKAGSSSFEEASQDPLLSGAFDILRVISLNEFNYKILQTILSGLGQSGNSGVLEVSPTQEKTIAGGVANLLDPSGQLALHSFKEVQDLIGRELKKIDEYVQSQALPSSPRRIPDWVMPGIEFMDSVLSVLRGAIPEFANVIFYLLFDEFENLIPVQQTIINEWVKTAKNFVLKVSSKFKGMYTLATLQGQPIQFGQDCPEVTLDYNLFDEAKFANYQKLLQNICKNLLEIASYKNTDIRTLLEASNQPELPGEVVEGEIKNIRVSAGLDFAPESIQSYREKLQEAAIFRLLRAKNKVPGRMTREKRYGGFDTFTYLSSGIIRIFLNLVGAALYKAEEKKADVRGGVPIPVDCQSWAAYIISTAWLDRIRSVYDMHEHGEKTYQLVLDLGDIFRERLLHHPTEPETLTIALSHPAGLRTGPGGELLQMLNDGVKESVFYERKESVRPKISDGVQHREYVLNRVYAPVLGISYRPRWPRACSFAIDDLLGLMDETRRNKIKRALLKQQRPKSGGKEHPTFDSLDPEP
jgi:hypothetical protein